MKRIFKIMENRRWCRHSTTNISLALRLYYHTTISMQHSKIELCIEDRNGLHYKEIQYPFSYKPLNIRINEKAYKTAKCKSEEKYLYCEAITKQKQTEFGLDELTFFGSPHGKIPHGIHFPNLQIGKDVNNAIEYIKIGRLDLIPINILSKLKELKQNQTI